ncbi:MAG: Ig-like domain-containing protein, partial [Theionarchaea archaeon]|nr:Ig-like domain-containing protein [Theionarchaea archaeon]
TVSGTVTCTAESNCDFIRWYIDDVFVYEDTAAPFQYSWDTTQYSDGSHTVRADGFCFGDEDNVKATDTVTCNIGSDPCLGTTILLLFVLFGYAGILRRR